MRSRGIEEGFTARISPWSLRYYSRSEEYSYKKRVQTAMNGSIGHQLFLLIGWLYLLYIHVEELISRANHDTWLRIVRALCGLIAYIILSLVEVFLHRRGLCEPIQSLLISLTVYANVFTYYFFDGAVYAFPR